jgi:hypothetical protein
MSELVAVTGAEGFIGSHLTEVIGLFAVLAAYAGRSLAMAMRHAF